MLTMPSIWGQYCRSEFRLRGRAIRRGELYGAFDAWLDGRWRGANEFRAVGGGQRKALRLAVDDEDGIGLEILGRDRLVIGIAEKHGDVVRAVDDQLGVILAGIDAEAAIAALGGFVREGERSPSSARAKGRG